MNVKRFFSFSRDRLLTMLALAVIMLSLAGAQWLMRTEFNDVQRLLETTEETVETRDLLGELLKTHLDSETGVRGYVIAGNEAFLGPYQNTVVRRKWLFDALMRQADPVILERLPELERLSDRQLQLMTRNVQDIRSGRPELARARVISGVGKRAMDAIRKEIAALDTVEAERLADLTDNTLKSRESMEQRVTGLLLGAAFLLAVVTLMVSRSIHQRRIALHEMRNSVDRQRAMFEGAVDGMLWLDENGDILRLNRSILRMFGYDEKELIGRHNMVLMADDFSMKQSRAWLRSVGKAGVDGAGLRQEFMGRRADGSRFETEIAISKVGYDDDKLYVASIRDISHRKRAERMKSEFVSTVSHELRTPLTSIGGSLRLLSAGAVGELNEKAARLVDIANSNCERLIRLINDILDIEKIESGKMSFDMRKMTIGPLIDRTINANRQFAVDHKVDFEVGLPPWPQCVMGDPDRLEQVLTNLVSNAIKHSPEGGTVEICSKQSGNRVRIEVADRGVGIPEEFRSRIFAKFAQADGSDSRAKGGTGLGLAIVRQITERHGGTAGFEDREGGGTVFYVDLPLMQERATPDQPSTPDLPLLLHIEDDLDCISVVESAFADRATIFPVTTLNEARKAIADHKFSASIVDVAVGPENGLVLLPALRETAPSLPIVLFTAMDDPHLDAKADAVMIKSRTSIEALVETTMALVSRARKDAV